MFGWSRAWRASSTRSLTMHHPILEISISPLRQRLIDDMNMRRFSRETLRNYLRDIGRLATFLGRSQDKATADDLRRFQIEQQEDGFSVPTMNSLVSALRFFFTQTLPPGLGAPARPAVAPAQSARGPQSQRGRPAAQRHHLPQAPGRALGCRQQADQDPDIAGAHTLLVKFVPAGSAAAQRDDQRASPCVERRASERAVAGGKCG
ncbi:phage integrase N-terminal SAM-like domain-containing protein [Mesorhizobium sp. M1380]|uniref:phage integrase N-terminal SAM-like domain-containing protein n=1 Tax=Mesorhizobium sp. M1380 TaxID=2957093 RepID=UPI0033353E8C